MARKQFVAGEEALAADINTYLMDQTVTRFATAAARTSAVPAPVLNQLSTLDTNPGNVDYWNGAAWITAGSGGELQYAQITVGVVINTTSSAGSNLVIAAPAQNFDGTPIIIEFFAPTALTPNVAGGVLNFDLLDAAANAGAIGQISGSSPNIGLPVLLRKRITPSAGSHTWRVAAWIQPSGSGQIAAGTGASGAQAPAYLRVTKA